jgi:ABC-type molybdate transport system substrate-binding protein
MHTKSNKRQRAWKILGILLFFFFLVSASETTNTSASKLITVSAADSAIDPARQHMLDIAYLYANHHWQETATNIMPSVNSLAVSGGNG